MSAANPAAVRVPLAARVALIARLRSRLKITGQRIDRTAESVSGRELDEIGEAIDETRNWLDGLGGLPDGTPEHEIEGSRDLQPRTAFLEVLARETLTACETARDALTELVAQFDAMPPIPPAGQPGVEEK